MDSIKPKQLYNLIRGKKEFSLIDLREDGLFGKEHILFAVNIPLSHLEFLLADLIPNRHVPIILCGKNEDSNLIEQGASMLKKFGYKNISMLEGGIDGWQREGFELFSGINVPSKAFGEFVELKYRTPHICAEELSQMIESNKEVIVLDSRPMKEYQVMNIPGGINVPGVELCYRISDLPITTDTTVVVNCAGRTRSIIGTQSLINMGIQNKVVALENGTMGWRLAGKKLEFGGSLEFPKISNNGRMLAKNRALSMIKKFKITLVDAISACEMMGDLDRTTYLFDVRDPFEFEEGHIPGSMPAPGGQLVQATDQYVGVNGSRLILVDDDDIRAVMTASWLKQMGWLDVFVLEGGVCSAGKLKIGPFMPRVLGGDVEKINFIDPIECECLLETTDNKVIDLASSPVYQNEGHIPGAFFAIRAKLTDSLSKIGPVKTIILTSPDGRLAEMAANDPVFKNMNVKVLKGGNAAWIAAGLPLEKGLVRLIAEAEDVWYRPYDLKDGVEEAMKQYLLWEVNLVTQIERDGTTDFQLI